MQTRIFRSLALLVLGLALIACQPVQPVATTEPALATYTDADGLFTASYPEGWLAEADIFPGEPIPHVAFGSHAEIIELSMAEQLLPVDQIGVALMLLPGELLAEAGVNADTPLQEVLVALLSGMADDAEAVAEMLDRATYTQLTVAGGAPAVQAETDGPTEAYVMTLAALEDGLYLVAMQIQALGHHNPVLEAQVAAIVDSFVLTSSSQAVMETVMARMAAMMSMGEETAAAPPTVTYTATEFAYEGPETIPGGLTRLELVNAGAQEHSLWLVKLEEGRTVEDVMGLLASIESDPTIPDWITFYGGITAGAGKTTAYTVDLAPGDYAVFSVSSGEDGVPDAAQGMMVTLAVTAAPATPAAAPVADARAELVDFSFVVTGDLGPGRKLVEITNSGSEPHEIGMLRLAEGASMQDVLDFMMAGEEAAGAPPFEFTGGVGPMAVGLTGWYEFDLEEGDYGLICFVPSAANEGAPHFMLGMMQQISVVAD